MIFINILSPSKFGESNSIQLTFVDNVPKRFPPPNFLIIICIVFLSPLF